MIRQCVEADLDAMLEVVNDAAQAYRGVIADDCWKDPYMPREELEQEIGSGVSFWCWEENGRLAGVMGLQDRGDVALIRHAYVRTANRNRGIGSAILRHLEKLTSLPILVGTWTDARWAVSFYQKHGYRLVTLKEKDRLLRKYWSLPDRQIETSVVLADKKWFEGGIAAG
jgi:N-acetylglutamate synthase-like GNAT family acetyltransferase